MHKSLQMNSASMTLALTQKQWDKLETLEFEDVDAALTEATDLEWSGHFGMALHFSVSGSSLKEIERGATITRRELLALLK